MQIILKSIKYSVLLLLTVVIMVVAGLFAAYHGYLNKEIVYTTTKFLSTFGLDATIHNLQIKKSQITINEFTLKSIDNQLIKLNEISIKLNLNDKKILVDIEKYSILNAVQEEIVTAKIQSTHSINFFNLLYIAAIKLDDIKGKILKTPEGEMLPSGQMQCIIEKTSYKKLSTNCNIHFGAQAKANISVEKSLHTINTHGTISDIPIAFVKLIENIMPQHNIAIFLNNHIISGHIKSGDFHLTLDENFNILPEKFDGAFLIENLDFKYDEFFPNLKNTELEIKMSKMQSELLIKRSYIGQTLVSDGTIQLDWKGINESELIIKAKATGPASDLVSFLSEDSYLSAKKSNIDLKKFTGTAESKIDIIIPLSESRKNTFAITTEISNAGIKIFNDQLVLSKAKANGLFNGAQIIFNGTGKINNYDSNIEYICNIDGAQELKVKTTISSKDASLGAIKILSGNATLNFHYKTFENDSTVTLSSDLQNLEFHLSKIPIYKPQGNSAVLNIKGKIKDFKISPLKFDLSGQNNLKIIGDIIILEGNKYKANFTNIAYKGTNIKDAKLAIDESMINANIKGNILDLSDFNMQEFLAKENEDKNINLQIHFGKVKLKNQIWLNDFNFTLECDKNRCLTGALDAQIGSKELTVRLKPINTYSEEWSIASTNAGAILKGLGMFDDMKSGSMLIALNTKRQEAFKGKALPVYNGHFTFKKFTATNISFLAQLVSYISLPGFMNLVTNSQDIRFTNMSGKFEYTNDQIQIYDTMADGQYFDFTMKGFIDIANRELKLQGNVIPSIYGINTLLKNIPIFGKIFSGGHRKGILSAPYMVKKKY